MWKAAAAGCRISRSASYFIKWRGFAEISAQDTSQLHQSILEAKPLQSIRIIRKWLSKGNKLSPENAKEIVTTMANRGLYSDTIHVIDYMRMTKILDSTPETCILKLNLVKRPSLAEQVYRRFPESLRNEEVTAAFISKLAKNRRWFKALKWMKDLKPQSKELNSAMIAIYSAMNMHEHMLGAYNRIRSSGAEPTLPAQILMLKHMRRAKMGSENLQQEAKEALDKIEVENADMFTLNSLMEGYGYLNEPEKVEHIWKTITSSTPPYNYMKAMSAYGHLGSIEKAEKTLEECIQMDKTSKPYLRMIEVYTENGLLEKAEQMVNDRVKEEDRKFSAYDTLAQGYLAKDKPHMAMMKLKEGYKKNVSGLYPSYETVMGFLGILGNGKGNHRDVRQAEKLVRNYLLRYRGDIRVYNGILKVYASAGEEPNEIILKSFKVEVNEETEELMKKINEKIGNTQE